MATKPLSLLASLAVLLVVAAVTASARADFNSAASEPSRETDADEYRLVWSDEFDIDGPPNDADWGYEHGFVRNEELQWYQPQNASCENGLLVIEGRRERVKNSRFDSQANDWRQRREYAKYTSASITTRGKHDWLYGRFEMRGRIDARPGLWPAFWTLGNARPWPGCGEIDVMEYYQGILLANAAWLGRNRQAKWDDFKRSIKEFAEADWASKFHLWRMEWDRDFVRLYVDDVLLNEVPLENTTNAGRERANPFREPHYVILNLAIGGTKGGDPSATEFPARFEVDYVRVYENKQSSSPEERTSSSCGTAATF